MDNPNTKKIISLMSKVIEISNDAMIAAALLPDEDLQKTVSIYTSHLDILITKIEHLNS